MDIYVRKIRKHDTTHQISITNPILKTFFGEKKEKEEIIIIGERSKKEAKISFMLSTDPRFGGDIKKLIREECEASGRPDIQEGDMLLFKKFKASKAGKASKYSMECIFKPTGTEPQDSRYEVFSSLLEPEQESLESPKKKSDIHLRGYLDEGDEDESLHFEYKGAHQQIYFGAPGTGKSYRLNQNAETFFPGTYTRVTFHPNYLYSNFVGTFKPFPIRSKDEVQIIYRFVPGPLITTLIQAIAYPQKNYLLIIEEINRADVAAVFGETFQLLDRRDGNSEYKIALSEDLRDFLQMIIYERVIQGIALDDEAVSRIEELITENVLYFPRNFYMWATMNSADQGVKPLDTAFKRRWSMEYVGINEGVSKAFDSYYFRIREKSLVRWDDFRREVNVRLSRISVPEDKLLGPYFIPKSILESQVDTLTDAVKNKVLMYLFDDAAKPRRRDFFSKDNCDLYSELCINFLRDGRSIFKEPLDIQEYPESSEIDQENTVISYNSEQKLNEVADKPNSQEGR